jgi:Ca2+-binding RTX toxin-like protein
VQAGDSDGSDAFDPAAQWDGFPIDSFDGLGSHSLSPGGGGGGGSNGAPNAIADTFSVDEDAGATPLGVIANDTDPDGDLLTITAAADGAHGTVTFTGSGNGLTYAPEVDFNGPDSFSYTVSDGHGGEDTATVTLTVLPVNDDPDPEDDAATTAEDAAAAIDVLANDTDVDGDSLSLTEVEDPEHGLAEVAQDGSLAYQPDADFNGSEVVEYTVSDGHGGVEFGEVLITVTPVNDPPLARPDIAAVRQDEPAVIDAAANDSAGPADETGGALTLESVSAPGHGQAELIVSGADQGKVRYTPSAGYLGQDSFTYVVSDGSATATGTVAVVVGPAPMLTLCGLRPTILGTVRADTLTGTPGDDVILARRGNDVIDGGGGNDVVCAGPGADRVTTGGGDDRIGGGTGPDVIESGGGHDRARGGVGPDEISAGPGDDSVAAGPGNDVVDGGEGNNVLHGGLGDDTLQAGSGNDRIDGAQGTDACDPGGGRNTVLRCE